MRRGACVRCGWGMDEHEYCLGCGCHAYVPPAPITRAERRALLAYGRYLYADDGVSRAEAERGWRWWCAMQIPVGVGCIGPRELESLALDRTDGRTG